ncbi:BTAD domain-containing putative transcriptional regulator [Streptomyces sp. NPDC020996]|uniref:AfsR/SARP family transcriptional regulator n=1 Tax=Streptomyces sp. NPDC020996 TaxID=3154791 RepID=UPI0033E6E5E2
MDVQVAVLGPMSATVGGRAVALGGLRQRAVLAVLVAARGRMVSADRIVADAWGEGRPPSAATLHSYVAELRKVLEPGRAARQAARVLVREGTGYALRLPADAVDAERFTDLTAQGQRLLQSGDPAGAADALRRALALWRGPAYAEFADIALAAPEVARLDGLRLTAHEDLYAAELALGRHAVVAGDLRKHTAEHPLSERGWELLALALYRSGHQGDALGALRTARRTLSDELGIAPGPSLRRLEAALLAQDDTVAAPPPPPPHPLPTPTPTSVTSAEPPTAGAPGSVSPAAPAGVRADTNLPARLPGSLVGRGHELAAVQALLDTHRLVTLTGAAGMGKTRLALETAMARDDLDGPWLVELAGLSDPALLPHATATALGMSAPRGVPDLVAALRDRRTLLVLDNCEHLVDAVAGLVPHLLAACPGLRVLATSQESLGLDGEYVYEVPPLPTGEDSDAVALFLDRAALAEPGRRSDPAERTLLAELCRKLDGMPLAIELAAAQCGVLSVRQIAEHLTDRLDERFVLLRTGRRDRAERHTTLLAAVASSFALLTAEEREVLDALAVFRGGFDLAAARYVTGRDDIVTQLTRLVAKSLVMVVAGSDPRRYRILETLRQYALRHAPEDRREEAVARRLDWAVRLAEEAYENLRGPRAAAWMRRLDDELLNIRAALGTAAGTGETTKALRIAAGLAGFWYRRGNVMEGIRHLAPVLDDTPPGGPRGVDRTAPRPRTGEGAPPGQPQAVDHSLYARAAAGLALLRYLDGSHDSVVDALHRAGFHAALADDLGTAAWVMATTSSFEALSGLPEPARRRASRALEMARATGSPQLVAEVLLCLGDIERHAGRPDAATAHLEAALDAADGCGYALVAGTARLHLAGIELDRDRPDVALPHVLRLVEQTYTESDTTFWLLGVAALSQVLLRLGHPVQAAELAGVVTGFGTRIGVSPQAMDPDGLGRYAARLRTETLLSAYGPAAERGRALSQDEVMERVRARWTSVVPATDSSATDVVLRAAPAGSVPRRAGGPAA